MSVADHAPRLAGRTDSRMWFERIPAAWWATAVVLLFLPVVANSFWLFQVMGWTFILGMIGLSLMFLAGYGGMVSFGHAAFLGIAGYAVGILAHAWEQSNESDRNKGPLPREWLWAYAGKPERRL